MSVHDNAFTFTETEDGRVCISYYGKQVTTLAGKQAGQFLYKAGSLDAQGLQLLMAKATGQFKRGNERSADKSGK